MMFWYERQPRYFAASASFVAVERSTSMIPLRSMQTTIAREAVWACQLQDSYVQKLGTYCKLCTLNERLMRPRNGSESFTGYLDVRDCCEESHFEFANHEISHVWKVGRGMFDFLVEANACDPC